MATVWEIVTPRFLVAGAVAVFFARFRVVSGLGIYLGTLALSFILFSAKLRWDPWHDRLQMGYLMLAAPFIAAVWGGWIRREWVAGVAGFFLLNAALGAACNPTYPVYAALFGRQSREELYFAVRPELYPPTLALAEDVMQSHCTNVFLKVDDDTWEYPLWVLLKNRGFAGTIRHALVENESARLPQPALTAPDSVILSMHADRAPIPADYGLDISYDTWRAHYRAAVPEQRARMMGGYGILKYTFAHPGTLVVRFDPRDAAGRPATNGALEVTIKNIETNAFHTVDVARTNLALAETTTFSCRVRAPSMTILITNATPGNAVAGLWNLDATEQVRAPTP